MRRLMRKISVACILTAWTTPVVAQDNATLKTRMGESLTKTPGFEFPADRDELDKALDSNNYVLLRDREKELRKEKDVLLWMNWLVYRQRTGGGYLVAKLYTSALWTLGESLERAGRSDGPLLKRSAVTEASYALAVSIVDSAQCGDPTAPSNRTQETLNQLRPIFLYGQGLPDETRQRLIAGVLNLERVVAPLRENDDALCRGGMAETLDALQAMEKAGKKPEARTVPGYYGKTVDVPVDGSYRPQFIPTSAWHPRRDQARETLQEVITNVLTPAAAANPNPQ